MEIVSVECIDTFDPKVIRINVLLPNGLSYSFDIPEPIYPALAPQLGLPTDNPCA